VAGRPEGDLAPALRAARAVRARRAVLWGGLALSALLLWLALRRVDLDAMAGAFGEVRWWTVPLSLAVLALGVWLRVLRWRALFTPEARPPFGATARALLAGQLFNVILPARAGEALRVVVLSRETRGAPAEVVATAVVERVYDVLALLVLLLVAAPFLPHVSWLGAAAIAAAVVAAGIAVVAVAAARGVRRLHQRRRSLRPFISASRAQAWAFAGVRGLVALRRADIAVRGLALTLASWLVLAGAAAILLVGFRLDGDYGAGLLVLIAVNLVLVVPSSPAAVGPFEAAVLVALSAFGIDSSHALSYALVLHAENLFPFVVAGYAALHVHARVVKARAPARAAAE